MITKLLTPPSAINPIALAEEISDKPIAWETDSEKIQKQLCDILGFEEIDLYDEDNPVLFSKAFKLQNRQSIPVRLAQKEKKKLISDYLKTKVSRLSVEEPAKIEEIKRKYDRIIKALDKAPQNNPNEKWMPDNVKWSAKGIFFNAAPEGVDPMQGDLGDCYFIAALASVAWAKPYEIVNRASIWQTDSSSDKLGNVSHMIIFYDSPKNNNQFNTPNEIEVSDSIPVNESDDNIIYAKSADENETWPAVYEKAYAKWRTKNNTDCPDYLPLAHGWVQDALGQLIGGTTTTVIHSDVKDPKEILKMIQDNCAPFSAVNIWGRDGHSKRVMNPMGANSFGGRLTSSEYKQYHLSPSHCYSILGWDYDEDTKKYYVVLRNPWGWNPVVKDVKQGEWKVLSNHFGYGTFVPLNGNDPTGRTLWSGVFAMELSSYVRAFYSTAVVK